MQGVSFFKSIELNPYVKLNESTVRKRIQDSLRDDEIRKVRKMHQLHTPNDAQISIYTNPTKNNIMPATSVDTTKNTGPIPGSPTHRLRPSY